MMTRFASHARVLGVLAVVLAAPCALGALGCGGAYYAKEHLHQAQIEASEASYSDAANFAEVAEEYASKAIELSRSARSQGQKP